MADERTIRYYDAHSEEASARYRSMPDDGREKEFREAFGGAGARVLDVGSGSGRDVNLLRRLGYDAFGSEPSSGMREACLAAYPELVGRIFDFALPLPEGADTGGQFDGVLCSAVLMHLPERELFNAAFSLKRLLRERGRLLLSVPLRRSGLDQDDRDQSDRLFTNLFPQRLLMLFEGLGLQLVRRWEQADGLGRPDVRWASFIFELDTLRGRPLDRIERVLNRDMKTATYKLALFRALSDIGSSSPHQAAWVSEGSVAVPIRLIAERWFRYYWPLFESREFMPQNNGERPGCTKPVAFRRLLTEIIETHGASGLPGFLGDERSGRLPGDIAARYAKAIQTIEAAIRNGPVVYTSGNMFSYDSTRRAVLVTAEAWREFCQLGHWIEPAVIMQWAELTSRMSANRVEVGEALSLLVSYQEEGRDVATARAVFDQLESKVCVWAEKPLLTDYAVDHAIPFSLWHCNELWNLLPCGMQVNNRKSDMLPDRELLFEAEGRIVHYWERLRQEHERRFDREVARFGPGPNPAAGWQKASFDGLVEAVELTAAQRGVERWRP